MASNLQARARLELIRSGGSSELDAPVFGPSASGASVPVTTSAAAKSGSVSPMAVASSAASFSAPRSASTLPRTPTLQEEESHAEPAGIDPASAAEPSTPPGQVMHSGNGGSRGAKESAAQTSPADGSEAADSAVAAGALLDAAKSKPVEAAPGVTSGRKVATGAADGHLHAAAAKPASDGITVNVRESSKSECFRLIIRLAPSAAGCLLLALARLVVSQIANRLSPLSFEC